MSGMRAVLSGLLVMFMGLVCAGPAAGANDLPLTGAKWLGMSDEDRLMSVYEGLVHFRRRGVPLEMSHFEYKRLLEIYFQRYPRETSLDMSAVFTQLAYRLEPNIRSSIDKIRAAELPADDGRPVFTTAGRELFEYLRQTHDLTGAEAFERMAIICLNNGLWLKAVRFFHRAVRLDPGMHRSWYGLGLCHAVNGEVFFRKAIAAKPDFAAPHYWMGTDFLRDGRVEDAGDYLREYLRLVDREDLREEKRIRAAKHFLRRLAEGQTRYENIVSDLPPDSRESWNPLEPGRDGASHPQDP